MEVLSLGESSSSTSAVASKVRSAKIRVIPDVHQDDLHCLLKLPNHTFISGSKDGSLKQWDFQGRLVKTVYNPSQVDYRNWITALSGFGSEFWLSGTRNNNLDIWDYKGNHQGALEAEPYSIAHKCKERNASRINCLTDFSPVGGDALFFVGRPTQFTTHRYTSNAAQGIDYTVTDPNDWVYAIHPLSLTSLLVVTGTRLDHYSHKNSKWTPSLLIEEARHFAHHKEERQRSYISMITPLSFNPSLFGLSIFNGSIQVFDVEKKTVVMEAKEHENRVWTIENTLPHSFASCADDGQIKLWDMRTPARSVTTWKDNEQCSARVSVLLLVDPNTLISGSCPDNVHGSRHKAQFSFWDLRA
jgi:WD40 repeat protein